MKLYLLPVVAAYVVGLAAVGCSASPDDPTAQASDDALDATNFVISSPLALDKTSAGPGDTVHATVTYKNISKRAGSIQSLAIIGLPPGAVAPNGTTFTPADGAQRIGAGATLTLSASLTFTGSESSGAWSVYSTFTTRAVHDGPSVSLNVTGVSSGSDGGTTNDGGTSGDGGSSGGDGGVNTSGLHVSGNLLLDGNGNTIQLHGVNRSGTEYACIQGWGIFDGPSDANSITAIKSWNSNIVRIPLNEDCWLGINGVNSAYGGANYVNAIVNYVNLLHAQGLYAELSLIWGAPGSNQATYQPGAPDEDHSPAFWSSLAATFKNDTKVILAPWGETIVDANCFLNGGVCEATYGSGNTAYNTAGMQQAVNLMRGAGYNGVIVIPGIDYANDLSQWLSHKPSDPLNQLMAEAHVYGKNTCDTTTCFNTNFAPVAAAVPLVFGETGETYDDSDCGSSYITTFMTWADAHGVGYEAWTWDTWGTCVALISNYSGTAANTYATYVKNHYATLP